jgi:hypothetical protein
VAASYLIQWAKRHPGIKFLNYDSSTLNRLASVITGIVSGAGIFFTWNRAAGTLLITGLTLAHGYHLLARIVEQVMMQHFIYRVGIAPPKWGALQYKEEVKNGGNGKPSQPDAL